MIEQLYNDNIGYVSDEVSSIKSNLANKSEKNRIKFITDIAAISRNKTESTNPEKRFKLLLKEAAPQITHRKSSAGRDYYTLDLEQTPSRPLEFLPVVIKAKFIENKVRLYSGETIIDFTLIGFMNKIAKYSYIEKDEDEIKIFTNARCLLNAGIEYDFIPYNTSKELDKYLVLKLNIPMFCFGHLMTHTALSKVSQSDRVSTSTDYWLPEGYDISLKDKMVNEMSMKEVQDLFKTKELKQRAPYYFKYKTFIMGGWVNDPNAWLHLIAERAGFESYQNWTQEQTKEIALAIRKFVENKIGKDNLKV